MTERSLERLDKVLVHLGIGSRSEIKKLAKQKAIQVNGEIMKDTSLKVNPYEDTITVQGTEIFYRKYIYIMLNKPQGVVSATEDARDKTVIDLLHADFRAFQPFPVGRLDKDTEGLLLLTNDGQLAHELLSPRKHVDKVYFVKAQGCLSERQLKELEQGVVLEDGYRTLPAKVRLICIEDNTTTFHLTITEGKYHQVKRMVQAIDSRVIYLKRLQMASLKLDPDLRVGEYRELTENELHLLKKGRENI